jgi:hypothetical protein
MTNSFFTVEVPYLKTPRAPQLITYLVKPVGMRQARFTGRSVAIPQLDLSAYSCRAVIDFVQIQIETTRRTQFRFIQKPIAALTGHLPHVAAINESPGAVATQFIITFQDPDLRLANSCLEQLRFDFGFTTEPQVHALEVSVDFSPRRPSEQLRHQMLGILTRHLFPGIDFLGDPLSRPRIKWGTDRGTQKYLIGKSRSNELDRLRWPLSDLSPACDATLYVGRRFGPAQWKIMDKVLDRQNHAADTRTELDEAKKRVRVEVTLNREELSAIGIHSVDSSVGTLFLGYRADTSSLCFQLSVHP